MSSTNKTKNLKLNSWIGSDKPQRVDFNDDNEKIDAAFANHTQDEAVHIKEAERNKWNNYIYTDMYFGDGSITRVIETDCPFDARFGLIFAASRPASVVASTAKKVNYLAFFSPEASTSGVECDITGTILKVSNSTHAAIQNEYINLNENGLTYFIVMFR